MAVQMLQCAGLFLPISILHSSHSSWASNPYASWRPLRPGFTGIDLNQIRHRPSRRTWTWRKQKVQQEALVDFRTEAINLFSNIQRSATFSAGVLVPLGFFAGPRIAADDPCQTQRMKRVHFLVSSAALCSHLIAIMYSTISVNKLSEVPSAPSRTVMDLLMRDYPLPWVGSNVHYLLGLLGMATSLLTFAQLQFGSAARSVSYMVCAATLHMIAVANAGIGLGGGAYGQGFARNLPGLLLVYLRLLVTYTVASRSIVLVAALGFGVLSVYHAAAMLKKDVVECPREE